jgi:NAD(P)H dehydrogenase (quinone)
VNGTRLTYGVTGASGKLGGMVLSNLMELVPARDVVATTRTPGAVRDIDGLGVQVRRADFDDPPTLAEAFLGVDQLLIISASNATGKRHDEHRAAVEAAVAAGVQRIVFTSMPNVDDPSHPAGLVAREYRDAEELVSNSGTAYTIARVAPYTELNAVERLVAFSRSRVLRMNAGQGRIAFISRRDVAWCLAAALVSQAHVGEIVDLTGDQSYTFQDVTEIVSGVLGIDVGYEEISDEEFEHDRLAAGDPELLAEALAATGRAFRLGYFDVIARHSTDLLGGAPASVRTVIQEHANYLRATLET